MILLHFYKQIKDGIVTAWITGTEALSDEGLTEVSEEEYAAAVNELKKYSETEELDESEFI